MEPSKMQVSQSIHILFCADNSFLSCPTNGTRDKFQEVEHVLAIKGSVHSFFPSGFHMRPTLWSSGTAQSPGLKTIVLTCPALPTSPASNDLNQGSELGPS